MVGKKSLFCIVCVACVLAGATGCATAQIVERLFPFLTPSAPVAPNTIDPTKIPGASEWSGQSGSSGHPLMTAEAILAAATNFNTCVEGLWPDAERRGVSRETFDTYPRPRLPRSFAAAALGACGLRGPRVRRPSEDRGALRRAALE